ncbi:MAG: DEAD/DEAH box helicase [Treponema sp.]
MDISFEDLGLEKSILNAIAAKGFETPTPIQVLAIPRLLTGEANVIAKARTGTGKTAAYGLPLVQELREDTGYPRALVLVPTRELALQVSVEIESFKETAYPRVTTVYGGASIVEQLKNLKRGCEIVVGTPGRVIDHLERGTLNLEKIEYFILDEADEMLNMGFIEDIETIFKQANPASRVLMFSATMPKQILKIAADFMGEYEIVEEKYAEDPLPLTEQFFWMVREEDKTEALVRLIDTADDFYGLVFCQTKADADAVAKELDERRYEAAALHGDIPQSQREKILGRFRNRKTRILVATDVAARGIDIEGITHVVNYSIPYDGPTYTHRIGRTGRAGAKGTAVSFIRPNERRRIDYLRRHARGELKEGKIPSIEAVLAQKKQRIFSELTEKIIHLYEDNSIHTVFSESAHDLMTAVWQTFIPTEAALQPPDTPATPICSATQEIMQNDAAAQMVSKLIAAVLQLQYGKTLSASHYRNIKAPRLESKKNSYSGSGASGTIRLYIGIGRKDGITKRGLAEMLSTRLGIADHAVDNIELFDRFSLVSLPADAAHEALRLSKRKGGMPHIHIDTKSSEYAPKGMSGGVLKKSASRKAREESRRESFFREKDSKKKQFHTTGTAAAYKKHK